MKTSAAIVALCAALLGLGAGPAAQAGPSDIDIYSGVNGADKANVLFIWDSSANWSATGVPGCSYEGTLPAGVPSAPAEQGTKLALEQCALYNLVHRLPVDTDPTKGPDNDARFNVGIMLMNESPNNGAYPRQRFIPVTTNNKVRLKQLIAGLTKNGDKGNNADYGQAMYEAYLYFKGMAPLNGTLGTKYDTGAVSGGRYVSPSGASCGRNYVIVIGNGSPQVSNPEKSVQGLMNARIDVDFPSLTSAERNALKQQIPDFTTDAGITMGNDRADWADEMARFMRQVDVSGKEDVQGIITHALAVTKNASDGGFTALMNSMANQGGGDYKEASNPSVLLQELLDIFDKIQAVNSVFASASLPVSVNARGTYQNQIFMGMFRPDENGKPRWQGNLKQYRFSLDNVGDLSLVDARGQSAINSSTGFISPTAISYWTESLNFWTQPAGSTVSPNDMPDGATVEKGAVSQRLRIAYATSQDARNVYTCIGCASGTVLGAGASTLFNDANTNLTAAALNASSADERTTLIEWVRGRNNAGEPVPTEPASATVRGSIHGDVLHSRPAVVNYGAGNVVVFYGSNDGQLRAINGNQTGAGAGNELWSFIPEEHFGKFKRLRSGTPEIELSTTPSGSGATPRDYGVDGPIGVYQKLNSTGGSARVIIYVGMRRGGRQLYALDVTDVQSPKVLWKVSNASAGMSLLGQTWSEPKVARVKGVDDPVVIFGGGYDAAAEDGTAATTMGNAVYVLNALSGELLKAFTTLSGSATPASLDRSIPADVTLVDSDYDGKIDRVYAADLGGRIYRVDFESTAGYAPADWTIYKVADLSGGTTSGRKFFYAPDVVLTKTFTALMIGSGDREKPLLTSTQDHFFEIFDSRMEKGAPPAATPIAFGALTAMGAEPAVPASGCYMALAGGEKVVNAATSIAGTSYFGTNRPSASAAPSNVCSANLGIAKTYAMPLFCVASSGQVLAGGGLPPSPVSGVVTVTKPDGSSVQVPFVIGAPNARGSAIEASRVKPVISSPRQRRYWYPEVQR